MAVVPASRLVDLTALGAAAGVSKAELASETEFKNQFPDCETGAMPPFGNLYNMRVYADRSLTRDREIVFNAGTHRELVRLGFGDFLRLVTPDVVDIATKGAHTAAA
jgi:Ala-tRNA(Pro) deacylase